jgi:serine/threonine protein kinase
MEIHSKLDHPNIIKCYQIIERPHHYYFVLEYCP